MRQDEHKGDADLFFQAVFGQHSTASAAPIDETDIDSTAILPGPEPESAPILVPTPVREPEPEPEPPAPAIEVAASPPRPSRYSALAVGGAVLCGIAFVSLLVALIMGLIMGWTSDSVTTAEVDVEQPIVVKTTSGSSEGELVGTETEGPLESGSESDSESDSESGGFATGEGDDESGDSTDTQSTESDDTGETGEDEHAGEAGGPVVSEPKKSGRRSKFKIQPAVKVSFLVAGSGGSKAVEIRAQKKRLTSDNGFKSTTLRPGKHAVTWRWKDSDSWHSVGSLTVESGLPAGSYYVVTLQSNSMQVERRVGGKNQ